MATAAEVKEDKKWKWIEQPQFAFLQDKEIIYEWIGVLLAYRSPFDQYASVNPTGEDTQSWISKSHHYIETLTSTVVERFTAALAADFYENENFWFRQGRAHFVSALMHCVYSYDKDLFLPFVVKTTEKAYTHVKGSGSLSSIAGSVGINLLSEAPTAGSAAAVLLMQYKAKHYVFVEEVEKALTRIRNQSDFDEDSILDKLVNDFGIKDNTIRVSISGYHATINISSYKDITVVWHDPSGKVLKSEPSVLKKTQPDDLNNFKSLLKDVKKTLLNQKLRLENSWRGKREWTTTDWKQYIINHPLTSIIGRQLIWLFTGDNKSQPGIWCDGKIVSSDLTELDINAFEKVLLWHPALSATGDVQQWRKFIFDHRLLQPFKQAFREVYIVTEAEIKTSTFSNRFSGHVLQHYKLKALAEQRQWFYTSVYSYDPPLLKLQKHNIEVHLNIQKDDQQVQIVNISFYTIQNRAALAIDRIPAVIFSETLRDVDLFVATSSIGIEEDWNQARYQDYWRNYSRGELSAIAETRRDVLKQLLPSLKISAATELTDKFLVVKGKLRTYKIHIGSTNILMEPTDQYLCIVPDRNKESNNVFLPFDEDAGLSIILSKAILLADDDKITDSTIVSQISRR